jgi:glycerol-3-phosphate dehydrogenase
MTSTSYIYGSEIQAPFFYATDLGITGGSCTGVFAAVRATRLGLPVALIERNSIVGGMATAAQVTGTAHGTRYKVAFQPKR